jgi:hypothetical protein
MPVNAPYLPAVMAQNESSNGTETHPQVNARITFPKHAPALSVDILTCTHERQHDIELSASSSYDAFFNSLSSLSFSSSASLSGTSSHLSSPFMLRKSPQTPLQYTPVSYDGFFASLMCSSPTSVKSSQINHTRASTSSSTTLFNRSSDENLNPLGRDVDTPEHIFSPTYPPHKSSDESLADTTTLSRPCKDSRAASN